MTSNLPHEVDFQYKIENGFLKNHSFGSSSRETIEQSVYLRSVDTNIEWKPLYLAKLVASNDKITHGPRTVVRQLVRFAALQAGDG